MSTQPSLFSEYVDYPKFFYILLLDTLSSKTQFQLLLYHYEFEISYYYYYNFKFRNKLNHAPKCFFLRFRINLL